MEAEQDIHDYCEYFDDDEDDWRDEDHELEK